MYSVYTDVLYGNALKKTHTFVTFMCNYDDSVFRYNNIITLSTSTRY